MSGKPAARQGDMTQYGGPVVQGSAGVMIGAPTGVACSVCPVRCRLCSPEPTAATGRKRLRRQVFSAPAGKRPSIFVYRYAIRN